MTLWNICRWKIDKVLAIPNKHKDLSLIPTRTERVQNQCWWIRKLQVQWWTSIHDFSSAIPHHMPVGEESDMAAPSRQCWSSCLLCSWTLQSLCIFFLPSHCQCELELWIDKLPGGHDELSRVVLVWFGSEVGFFSVALAGLELSVLPQLPRG